jgi:hypothetical protein
MAHHAKWLVVSGLVGVLVAAAIYVLGTIHLVRMSTIFNPYVILALAPAWILGMANPTTLWERVILWGIVLCTNFVLYGVLGLILNGAWSLFHHRTTS